MNFAPTRRKKWFALLVKLLVVAIVVWGVRHTLLAAWVNLEAHQMWPERPAWLVAAGVFYLASIFPAAIFWHRILLALGQRPRLGETIRAYYIGHLGKYVPGKAMVVVLRTGLLRSQRATTAVVAVSVFVETLTMMAVGACLAATILMVAFPGQMVLVLVAVSLMIAAGVPTLPPVFRRLAGRLPLGARDEASPVDLHQVSYRLMAGGWVALACGWVLMGLSLWATLRALEVPGADAISQLPLYTASVSLAVVAGFLSLVPGGAVIRELILAQVLVPQFGETVAVVSALLLRLVWLVSELGISGILYVWKPRGAERA